MRYLRQLHRIHQRPLVVVMDRLNVHRSAVRKLQERGATWLDVEWLPAYAPDLNPVEALWSHAKYSALANFVPDDVDQLYDAVVNAVGVLRDTRARPIDAVHRDTPIALFDACAQAGVQRVVHISALGIDGSNAARQIARIATGWRLKAVAEPLIVCTHAQTPEAILAPKQIGNEDLERCRALGEALAAGLVLGVF